MSSPMAPRGLPFIELHYVRSDVNGWVFGWESHFHSAMVCLESRFDVANVVKLRGMRRYNVRRAWHAHLNRIAFDANFITG